MIKIQYRNKKIEGGRKKVIYKHDLDCFNTTTCCWHPSHRNKVAIPGPEGKYNTPAFRKSARHPTTYLHKSKISLLNDKKSHFKCTINPVNPSISRKRWTLANIYQTYTKNFERDFFGCLQLYKQKDAV